MAGCFTLLIPLDCNIRVLWGQCADSSATKTHIVGPADVVFGVSAVTHSQSERVHIAPGVHGPPDQTTFSLFSRAKKFLSRIIDEILDTRSEVIMSRRDIASPLDLDLDAPFSLDLEGIELLNSLDFRDSFNQKLR